MRDTAALADQSDPGCNALFSRRWTGPPPRNRKGPGVATRASFGKLNHHSKQTDSTATKAAERAVCKARRRAAELDRLADFMLALGYAPAAERFSHQAHALREAVLA
jgi:hypothetical protein